MSETKLVATVMVLSAVWTATAETVPLWAGGAVPKAAELERPAGIEFSVIKKNEPQADGYNWLHGVAICWHKGRLWAFYGTNRGKENTPTEEMHARASDDGGKTWGPVQVVAKGGDGCGVSHGALASKDGELWCFAGTFSNKCSFVHTRAFTLDEASGMWTARGAVAGEGFWPMQSPQRLPDGNWIIGGLRVASGWNLPGGARPAAAISRGNDFTKWDVSVVGKGEVANIWGEATVDTWGLCVTLTMRPGWKADPSVAYIATSADCGRTWTPLKPTNLPLATSKPFTGVLSTGQRYVISQTTADGGTRRFPLTIAVSRPGEWAYSRVYLIRHAVFPEGPGASHPKAALSYPYAVEHDGKLYVAYSNSNGGGNFRNSAELAVIPVTSLRNGN